MIHKVEITGVHTVPDDQIKDYLKNSIAKLEHYIPKHARDSAHIDAKLIENRSQGDKKCTVEIILYLPRVPVAAKESCATMPEAIDLVEGKIVAQLKKYKDTHTNPRLLRRLTNKLRRKS